MFRVEGLGFGGDSLSQLQAPHGQELHAALAVAVAKWHRDELLVALGARKASSPREQKSHGATCKAQVHCEHMGFTLLGVSYSLGSVSGVPYFRKPTYASSRHRMYMIGQLGRFLLGQLPTWPKSSTRIRLRWLHLPQLCQRSSTLRRK